MHTLLHGEALTAQGQADGVLRIAAHLHNEHLDGNPTTITALRPMPSMVMRQRRLILSLDTTPEWARFSGSKPANQLMQER